MSRSAKQLFLAFTWVASLVLVYWLGRGRGPVQAAMGGKPMVETPIAVRESPAQPAARAGVHKTRSTSPDPTAENSGPTPAQGNDFSAGLKHISTRATSDVLSNNDPIERTASFIDLLRRIDRTNAREILDAFEEGEFGYDRSREYSLFLYAWGQVDGPAASKHLQEKGGGGWDRMRDIQSVLAGWATRNPDGAVDWAKQNWQGEENPYLIGGIKGLAKNDLARAGQLTESLPYGRVRGMAADTLVDGHLQKGERSAMDWAESIQDERLKQGIIQRTAIKLSQKNPESAADWVMTTTTPERRRESMDMIMENWGRRDPREAAAWVDRQSDEATKALGLSSLTSQWARRDAVAAGQWLAGKAAGPGLDPALESYVRVIRRNDPASAMQWAGSISDTEKRRGTLENIMNEWMERDPQGAQDFLNRKPSPPGK